MTRGLLTVSDGATERETSSTPSTIVVPVDGGAMVPGALVIARRWAAIFGCDLVVVGVEGERDRAELVAPVDDAAGCPVIWHSVPRREQLVPAVVELTARADEPAICIATGAHSPWVDVLVGDVAQQLLRAVDAPVLLVGPHCRMDARDGPVVVAHDGLRNDDAVLGAAGSWAAALGVRPVVLHVYQPLSGDLDDVMPTLRAACEHVGAGDVEVVRGTFPAGAIREYAHEVGASLLALSTHGRTETLTASAGRTARWVVRESPCPVLIAHPS